MSITIDLAPDVEARLGQVAIMNGQDAMAFVKTLVEVELGPIKSPAFDEAAWNAAIAIMEKDAEQMPVLPPEACSRKSIYEKGH